LTPQPGGHDIPSAINSPHRPARARSFIRTRRPGATSAHQLAATYPPGVCRMAHPQNSLGLPGVRPPPDRVRRRVRRLGALTGLAAGPAPHVEPRNIGAWTNPTADDIPSIVEHPVQPPDRIEREPAF